MLTLILGGARSGKSDLALRLASSRGHDVLFLATMQAGDEEMRSRIEAHRAQRPSHWRTIEEPRDVVDALRREARPADFVIVDCLTLWVSNLLVDAFGPGGEPDDPSLITSAASAIAERTAELLEWWDTFAGELAIVSNEVGLGVVPPYPLGRAFRDALGSANRLIAAHAVRVYYLVAGLALEVKALGAVSIERFDGPPTYDPDL